jgi:hypothetical protein
MAVQKRDLPLLTYEIWEIWLYSGTKWLVAPSTPGQISVGNFSIQFFGGTADVDMSLRRKLLVSFANAGSALARLSALLVFAAHQQRGNRMLEDELFLFIRFKHD